MNRNFLPKIVLFVFLTSFFSLTLNAQTGCPGCIIELPVLPEDTLYVDSIPDGILGAAYDEDMSFRFPVSTTPVHDIDPSIPPGLDIDEITITSLSGLPAGLSYEFNETLFDPSLETDGCIKLCGTPLQTGLFLVNINVDAKISILTQSASFSLPIFIQPPSSTNDGFSMTNNIGCEEVSVSFQNNVPSNGQDGFSYFWDFDNGNTSLDENPGPQTYDAPGTYIVSFEANIDTTGFLLNSVTIIEKACDDIIGGADLFVRLFDPGGALLFESGVTNDANLPLSIGIGNIEIEQGNYSLEVWDKDSGLEGADDLCGIITINQLSSGMTTTGDLTVDLNIAHPVFTIESSDTVTVYPNPTPPELALIFGSLDLCPEEKAILESSIEEGNQWFIDTAAVPGAVFQTFNIESAGNYFVEYTDSNGCSSFSDTITATEIPGAPLPIYFNDDNYLELDETVDLPDEYSLQWYLDEEPIEGATDASYCIEESGDYGLEIIDEQTGCSETFVLTLIYNADGMNENCVVINTEQAETAFEIRLFPNPFSGQIQINYTHYNGPVNINIKDINGRSVHQENILNSGSQSISTWDWPSGMYIVEIEQEGKVRVEKLVKQ